MFIQSAKKNRLSLDVIGQLEDDLEVDPLNYNKWCKLIKQVLIKDKEEQVRAVFTKYLSIFKFDGNQWCNYINYELNRGEFQKVETLFQECFSITHSVELCRLYVSYVRRVNDVITGGEKARGIVIQAFEFAISKVGIDITSGDLWNDYLEFLKSWTPAATWEQQQKVDLIRKVYKRFLVIPTEKIEASWSQYTKWENEINPATASKFISEKSAEFMLARSWNTEWHNVTDKSLKWEIVPYGVNDDMVQYQLKLWYNWIELEKKNNLQLKDDTLLQQRIEYVYKQSTFSLPFVPELWFKFNKFWLFSNEEANLNKCIELLNESLILNPKSLLLSFQLAELYEKDNSFNKSKETYNNLIHALTNDYDKISQEIESINNHVSSVGENNEMNGNKTEKEDNDEVEDQNISPVYQLTEEDHYQLVQLRKIQKDLSKSITLVYIKLMLACKRSEGIKEARSIFKQARPVKAVCYELYVENALMEHYSDNKKTALKVFKIAADSYGTNGEFLLCYLNYLINNNDVDNIRKLIQASDANISKEIASINEELVKPDLSDLSKKLKLKEVNEKKFYLKKLFKIYISYALNYLSLDVAHSFANKCEQLFPDDDPIDLFSYRYRIGNLNLIKQLDLGEQESSEELERSVKRRKIQPPKIDTTHEASNSFDMTKNRSHDELNIQISHQVSPQQSFVGNNIYNLLRVLPNASYFGSSSDRVFNSEKLVELFSNLPDVPID